MKDKITEALTREGWPQEEIDRFLESVGKHLDIETGEWVKGLVP